MVKRFLISLLLTGSVSAGFGGAAYFFKFSFWGIFIATFLLQIIFFYVWNGYQANKNTIEAARLENERIADLAKQTAVVECSSCREKNLVPIRLDEVNQFECTKCKNTNSVYISIEAAQATIPVTTKQAVVSEEIVRELADKAVEQAINESTNKTTKSSNTK